MSRLVWSTAVCALPCGMARSGRSSVSSISGKAVSRADLAAATGFSAMTVHRALKGSPLVGTKSRAAIMAAAERLGYRLNASARAMRTGRFQTIGVVIGHQPHTSVLPNGITQALARQLAARRYRLTIAAMAESDLDDPDRLPQLLSELSVDGLLVKYDHHLPPRMTSLLERSGVPVWYLNSQRAQNCVYTDDLGAAESVTRLVIAEGASRVVYASLSFNLEDPAEHYSARDRLVGCRTAAAAADVPLHAIATYVPPHERVKRCCDFLREVPWPWAAIGYGGDEVGVLFEAARRLGHNLDQFGGAAVMGPVDSAIAEFAHWGDPAHEAQVTAVLEGLFASLDGDTAPRAPIIIPVPMVRRQSLGHDSDC
jgi:DNA-binding LacI/PurR family transcriptional regulator